MHFKQLRKQAGLTQEQVASELGVKRSTVSKWDALAALPRAELLPKIALLYGCSIDDLFVLTTKQPNEIIPESEGK